MKKIVDVSYECDICHRRWNRAKDARTCETSPRPALRPGDVVLWAGSRDDQYGALQSLVVDVVKEIELEMRGPTPGHEPRYTLTKENSVHQRDIVSPRRGYLNVTQGAFYVLHDETNFTLADMRKEKKGKASAAFKYLGKTLDWDRRIANCYEALRDVQYSGTWHGNPNVYHLRRLLPEDAQVLAAITLEPTDETIYELLGMRRYDDSKYVIDDQYSDPQDFYHAFFHWGFLVKHDLWRAFDLMTRPLDEIVAFVRDYRARILRGELPAPSKGDFARKLFKPNPVFAKKSWGTEVNAWAIKNNIKGGVSQRRLISAWETALTAKGEEEEFTMKTMKLFEGKKVIAIGSGKGGVGKSTVAADLARALVAEGKKVLMVDLDLGGSSQHLLFPVKKKESRLKTHDGKIVPHVVDGVEVVSFGYILESSEALTLRGPHLESAFHALASHIESNADIVVIDMPPGSSDLPLALEDFCPQTLYLVVATAGDVALADVRRMLSTLKSGSRSRIIGLIENMAYIEHNGERIALFGDKHDVARLAAEFNLPILCTLPLTARENRIALLRQEILPTLFHSLEAGVSYQKVSNKIIADEVKRLVNEWRERRDENKAESGITHVTSRSNILTELRYIITTQGGNPDDKQYQHVLTKGVAAVARAAGKYCSGKEL